MRKLAPLPARNTTLTAALALAGALLSSNADASQCSAGVRDGKIKRFTGMTATERLIYTPLLEEGKYLMISLPQSYFQELSAETKSMSVKEKKLFYTKLAQGNINLAVELAYSTPGDRSYMKFECADKDYEPPVAKPAAAPKQAKNEANAATSSAEDKQPDQEPPARRRTIRPGKTNKPANEPAQEQPEAKKPPKPAKPAAPAATKKPIEPIPEETEAEEQPEVQPDKPAKPEPAPPVVKPGKGDGSKENPFVMKIPGGAKSGMGGKTVQIPLIFSVNGKRYFSVKVTLSQLAKSRIKDTYNKILSQAKEVLKTLPENQGGKVYIPDKFQGFEENVKTNFSSYPDVLNYLETH